MKAVQEDAATKATPGDRGSLTRAALVESATELFVEEGYGAVSVRDLARRTHLTSGAIYGHFRNKADLLVATIADRIANELESPTIARHPSNLASSIGRQWATYRSRTSMRALLVEGAAAARVDRDVSEELTELLDTKLKEWRAIYREVQVAEKMDPDADMDTLVVVLFAAELGLGMLESIGVDLPKPTAWARTIERLLTALHPRRRR
jgi:AcrR family transcriptional regulator